MAKSLRLGNKAKTYVKALKKRVVNTSMNNKLFLMFMFVFMGLTLASCHQGYEHKTVVCIPVYGQSYALGEEAIRITDFDSLALKNCYAIVKVTLVGKFDIIYLMVNYRLD